MKRFATISLGLIVTTGVGIGFLPNRPTPRDIPLDTSKPSKGFRDQWDFICENMTTSQAKLGAKLMSRRVNDIVECYADLFYKMDSNQLVTEAEYGPMVHELVEIMHPAMIEVLKLPGKDGKIHGMIPKLDLERILLYNHAQEATALKANQPHNQSLE